MSPFLNWLVQGSQPLCHGSEPGHGLEPGHTSRGQLHKRIQLHLHKWWAHALVCEALFVQALVQMELHMQNNPPHHHYYCHRQMANPEKLGTAGLDLRTTYAVKQLWELLIWNL